MIEKINLNKRNSFGTLDWLAHWNEPSGAKLIEEKINELVDAVNGILAAQEQYATIYKEDIMPMLMPENEEQLMEDKDLSDKIGKLEIELDRTRKALDVAVDALKTIKFRNETYNRDDSPDCIDATLALDQIKTALEQKDGK